MDKCTLHDLNRNTTADSFCVMDTSEILLIFQDDKQPVRGGDHMPQLISLISQLSKSTIVTRTLNLSAPR